MIFEFGRETWDATRRHEATNARRVIAAVLISAAISEAIVGLLFRCFAP